MAIDISKLKKDFPILKRRIYGHKLVYLDNAATSQKPRQVLAAILDYYENHNANVHRGVHTLSEEATQMYEDARKRVARFINARFPEEVIFTKGATEALNRVAISWGLENLKKGDVVLLTDFEHHSNQIPWMEEAKIAGAHVEFLDSDKDGQIPFEQLKEKITDKVKMVAITHASNVVGTILPVKEICKLAHARGALVSVDGAQAVPHLKVDVQSLGCDFYSFSGHKMLGPMGIGVLWGRKELLEKLEPYEFGGGMIESVTYTGANWTTLPERLEAGTPDVGGAIGLAAACDYLEKVGMENVREHEIDLTYYAMQKLQAISGLKILGPQSAGERTGLVSFTVTGIHSHDLASVLSALGIAVRSGHHCAMPYHTKHNISASTRASFYIYNDKNDIDKLVSGIREAIKTLG